MRQVVHSQGMVVDDRVVRSTVGSRGQHQQQVHDVDRMGTGKGEIVYDDNKAMRSSMGC